MSETLEEIQFELVPVEDHYKKAYKHDTPKFNPNFDPASDPWAHVSGDRGWPTTNPWVGKYDRRKVPRSPGD